MRFLTRERETLDRLLPGLDARLSRAPLAERECPGNDCIAAFRASGGPGLLVPAVHGGRGARPVEALRVQRAIGSRSPSLAVATTMHHFSVASLVDVAAASTGFEWMLLEGIAKQGRILASGFAEGRPGQSILAPTMQARPSDSGFIVSGSKKPCSLSRSMDILAASVAVPSADGGTELAVALIPARDPGIDRRPFWNTPILAGAESDEVVVRSVTVPEAMVVRTGVRPADPLDDLQITGFLWFELLITASYLGVVSALVELVLEARPDSDAELVSIISGIEASATALEALACSLEDGERGEDALTRVLLIRYAAQDAISRGAAGAVELLGGMAFIRSADVSYLASAAAALAFHPPQRSRMRKALSDALVGDSLELR